LYIVATAGCNIVVTLYVVQHNKNPDICIITLFYYLFCRDQYDWWFQKVHPLHSPDVEPEPQPKQRKRPLRRSVLSKDGSKLSTETTSKSSLTGKSSLPGHKSSLTRNSSFTSKSSSIDKSSLTDSSNPIQESDAKTSQADAINETNMTISKPEEAVKRPRRCWQLNGHNSSGTPKHLASLPLGE
jgi:hypothetical protein